MATKVIPMVNTDVEQQSDINKDEVDADGKPLSAGISSL